jgi:hypothetical protein
VLYTSLQKAVVALSFFSLLVSAYCHIFFVFDGTGLWEVDGDGCSGIAAGFGIVPFLLN